MDNPKRRWIAAGLVAGVAAIGAATWSQFGGGSLGGTAYAASAEVDQKAPAHLLIRNNHPQAIRGRVRGPGPVTRVFFVTGRESRDMVLPAGNASIEIDGQDGSLSRALRLVAGDTTVVEYGLGR